jgi:hypothetical protein
MLASYNACPPIYLKMTPPKRALFSLNLDTEADHVYQRTEDHSRDGHTKVKVLKSSGPTTGNTRLEFVTKPFEKVVDRTVQGVLDGTGKKVQTTEGEIEHATSRSEKGYTKASDQGNGIAVKRTSKIGNRSSENKKNKIWEEYDTSDL